MSLQLGIFGYQPPPTVRPDPRFVVVRDGQTFERAIRELAAQPALTFDFETSGLAWYHKARAIGLAAGYMRADGYIQNFYFLSCYGDFNFAKTLKRVWNCLYN